MNLKAVCNFILSKWAVELIHITLGSELGMFQVQLKNLN